MTMDALPETLSISAIEAFTDNYIWCIHNDRHAIVVDPGDAEPVLTFLHKHNLSLAAILITHHHHDHTGGIPHLVSANPSVPVIGPRGNHIRGITKSVAQGDTLRLPIFDLSFSIIETPGHTLDHIAFYGHGLVFCGDTLFSAGCGRLFEGSAEQMAHSLNKFKRLPDDTWVYCAHEYTKANVTFSLAVDPDNQTLNDYASWVKECRKSNQITLPSLISKEKAINPFLRCHTPSVQRAVAEHTGHAYKDDTATFAGLRRWKDEF